MGVGWVVAMGPNGDNVVPTGDPIMTILPPLQYGNMAAMAVTLAQTLGQNVGMMWNKHRASAGSNGDRGGTHGDNVPSLAPQCSAIP